MRLSQPRVEPVTDISQLDEEAREIISRYDRNGAIPNIFRTLIRHPKLLKRWTVFGNHILGKSTLPPRERELLILRTGALCRCDYEFNAHSAIGRRLGITEEELKRVVDGPEAEGWDGFASALLRAADELHEDAFISDETWKVLSDRYNEQQLMDVVFTVGQYHLVSMALNSLGVQADEGEVLA